MTRLHLRSRLRAALFALADPAAATITIRPLASAEQVEVEHSMNRHALARRLRVIADRLEREP